VTGAGIWRLERPCGGILERLCAGIPGRLCGGILERLCGGILEWLCAAILERLCGGILQRPYGGIWRLKRPCAGISGLQGRGRFGLAGPEGQWESEDQYPAQVLPTAERREP
jgi:hypothetical protein